MRFEQILIGTSLLCFSWSSAALAQLEGVADGQILTQSVSGEQNLIPNVSMLATDTFLAPPRIQVLPDIPPLIRGARGVKSVASKKEIDITHSAIGEGRAGQWGSPTTKQQLAQNTPTIHPGTIEPTRPTLPLPTTPPQPPTPLPPLTAPNQIPGTPPPELGVKVKVQRVEVLGSTAFSPAELDAAVAAFIGKEATFEDLLEIRAVLLSCIPIMATRLLARFCRLKM
jgi:hypothetical protein